MEGRPGWFGGPAAHLGQWTGRLTQRPQNQAALLLTPALGGFPEVCWAYMTFLESSGSVAF